MSSSCASKCHGGPGYASPQDAMKGPRENVLFVTAPHASDGLDAVFAVDVNPKSENYCRVISRVDTLHVGDEVHHTGWNACSSCHDKPSEKRSHLVVPCLNSDRIYIINVEDEKNIFLQTTIDPSSLHKLNLSFPHTSHCLADGNIMISTLGTSSDQPSGNFLLLDGRTFQPKGTWPADGKTVPFNYDFWYQPRQNVMISTEWGSPNHIKEGFNPQDVANGLYGNSIHVFEWNTKKHKQSIELPLPLGALPLEVRFLHEPTKKDAFVGCALGSSIFWIHPDLNNSDTWKATMVAEIPSKKVSGWALAEMPALITDIIISMDDRFLYVSCWLHGDIRQYDISDPANPKLSSQIYIGGSIHSESNVVVEDEDWSLPALYVQGRRIEGGPQMLQLSLDGQRLYVTTSLYKKWDEQFYPNNVKKGAAMLQIDVDPTSGKMTLNSDFLIDFGIIPGGPYLAHEMRYPGGDCTSDIWI